MNKIAVGADAKDAIDIDQTILWNLQSIARARGRDLKELTVAILDRPRHEKLIHEVQAAGARIKLLLDGDIAGAIMAARPRTGVDVLMGIGGAPEEVVSACELLALYPPPGAEE